MLVRRCALQTFAVLAIAILSTPSRAEPPTNKPLSTRESFVLEKICAPCHARPGIGVPLVGDEAEWKPRRAAGLERLLTNTIEGKGGMPPLGTCSFCSEDELRRLIAVVSGMPRGVDR